MRSKKALINIISSLTLQIVTIICGFIIPKLIISTYGSNVNGLITSITQFLAFITFLEAGFGPVIKSILYKPIADKDKNKIAKILKASEKLFRTISYIFLIYIVILCIVLPLRLSEEFNKLYTLSLIIIISISTFAEYFFGMTYRLYLQAEQKTYIIAIIQIGTLILNTIAVLVLIYFGQSIQIVKLVSAFIFVLRPILQNIYVKKKYKINLKMIEDNYKIKQKWNGLAQHIAYVVNSNTDVAILTIYGDLAQVSVYYVYSIIINSVKNVVESSVGGIDAAFGDMIAKGEQKALNKNFKIYEGFYFTVASIAFSAMLFLIVPFVKLYTQNITDADYIRPVFAYLMVLAKLVQTIRQPYNDLVKVSGHFKQTRIGAVVEAISNVGLSFVLVWYLGIVGVAIGTLFAMSMRTIEFICYTSKHILKRSILQSFKNIIIIALEIIIIMVIVALVPKIEVNSYITWIINAIIVCIISSIVILLINGFIYKDNFKIIFDKIKK